MSVRSSAVLIIFLVLASFAASAQSLSPAVLPSAQSGCTPPGANTPCAVLNTPYTAQIAVVNPPNSPSGPVFSFSGGIAPPGLNIDSAEGIIAGSPTQGGLYTFTVSAVYAGVNVIVSQQYSLSISAGFLTITQPQSLAAGTVGVPIIPVSFAATGGVPFVGGSGSYHWSIVTGSQPDGLAIDPNTGVLSGTPVNAGTFQITVGVLDAIGTPAIHVYSFTANGTNTLTINTTSLPAGLVGTAYSQNLQQTGGPAPGVTWSVTTGALPPGTAIASNADSSGTISGTPTTAGTFNFTVQATYNVATATSSVPVTATQALSIVINAPVPPLALPSPAAVTGVVNQQVTMQFTASGGTTPYTYSVQSGTLPPGTSINAQTGAVAGQATTAGTFTFTIKATDSSSPVLTATAGGSITINPVNISPITITPSGTLNAAGQPAISVSIGASSTSVINGTLTLSFARPDNAGSQEVRFSNGSNSVNFTVTPGSTQATLPLGFSLLTGTIGGTGSMKATFFDPQNNILGTSTVTFTINSTAPVIKTFTLSAISNGAFTATIVGYSTTLDMTNAVFHFVPTTGTSLAATDVTVPLGPAFQTWYGSIQANPTGSQFTLKVPFTFSVTGGTSSIPIAAATVTLTNSSGSTTSPSANPQ